MLATIAIVMIFEVESKGTEAGSSILRTLRINQFTGYLELHLLTDPLKSIPRRYLNSQFF